MREKVIAAVFLLLTLVLSTIQQIPHGTPVQHGYFIPVNATTNNSRQSNLPYPQQPANYGWSPPKTGWVAPPYPPQQRTINSSGPAVWAPQSPQQGVNNTPGPNDWVMGTRRSGDQLLFKTIVTKGSSFFSSSVSKEIVFPDPNSKERIREITSIVVKDNTKKGNGGNTHILNGGVGKPYVNLKFKSKSNKGIDVSLEIYGY